MEGENALRVVVTSNDGTGHDTFTMKIDTPPSTPVLTPLQRLVLVTSKSFFQARRFRILSVAYYQVYLSTDSFESSDYEQDGPEWAVDAPDALKIPLRAGEVYDWSIGGLENDTTYYIALRAFDDGGKLAHYLRFSLLFQRIPFRLLNSLVKPVVFVD